MLAFLRDLIAQDGPLTLAQYMTHCLSHPRLGYYITRDPLGARGDFTTAPEISQMFGELIGLWCAQVWQDMGAPGQVDLIEPGPGRGTLMADALRALKILPGVREAVTVRLAEISPALRDRQAQALEGEPRVYWHDSVQEALDASDRPVLLIANEFFDALPIRQFVASERGWHERMIGIESGRLAFALSPEALPALEGAPALAEPGAIHETSPAATAIADEIARAIAARGGAGLIIDYGYEGPATGDTFQALRNHVYHDVLQAPGEADLTAHVDFAALRSAAHAAGAATAGPVGQGAFLMALGLAQRADRLADGADADTVRRIEAAANRLVSADEMGTLFKVMAVTGPGLSSVPGF